MKNFSSKNFFASQGFTIVEALVAISILSLTITATFTAVQRGLSASSTAKDQITAFYLAQEAMEYLRNMRDENALHSVDGTETDWLAGFASNASDPCYFGTFCTIDSPLKVVATCPTPNDSATCPPLLQDTARGLYGYTGSWAPTGFKRYVSLEQISAEQVMVSVVISWDSTHSVQVRQLLFNY